MIVLYVIGKFLIYCALCFALIPLFRLDLEEEGAFVLRWAGARLLLGLSFAIPLAYFYALLQHWELGDVGSYAAAFGGLRMLEWGLLFGLLSTRYPVVWGSKAVAWIAGGAIASMVSDWLAMSTGLNELKFFC